MNQIFRNTTACLPLHSLRLIVLLLLFGCGPLAAATQEEADALFAQQQWAAAVTQYRKLVADDPANANNWFQLGAARDQLGQSKRARKAYRKALAAGYQPEARARYALARVLMKLDDTEAALSELETVGNLGGPNFRTVQNTTEFQPLLDNPRFQAVIKALQPCASEQHRQFDFWLGTWDVTAAGASQPTATNTISIQHDGCVLLEQYANGPFTGMSINFYDAIAGRWHQTWMSNAGGALYLEGGLTKDGAMEMTDAALPITEVTGSINKVVWTPLPDGAVRQLWTATSDGGENWSVVFDGIYERADN